MQRHQVVVDGNSADTVSISGGGFTAAGTAMHDSVTYTVYDSAIDHAQLLINAAVQVNGLVLG